MVKPVVVKISGRIISPQNIGLVKEYSRIIGSHHARGARIAVVVGGGATARTYIEAARSLGCSEAVLDIIGIDASRLNARLLIAGLGGNAHPLVPHNLAEFLQYWESGKIVVAGGFQPGQSTNAVAAVIAEAIGAERLVNATLVDGIYDKDPSKHRDAKLLERLSYRELREILQTSQTSLAGAYELFDPVALNVAERSGIKLVFINGWNPENLAKALRGEKVGTLVG